MWPFFIRLNWDYFPLQLRYAILLAAVFCMVQSQRPWHAGTGNRLPQVLPQYVDERIAAEQATQAGQVGQGDQIIPTNQETQGILVGQGAQGIPVGQGAQGIPEVQGTQGTPVIGTDSSLLGNRIDSGEGFAAAPTLSTINPADLPVDARGDIDLVNRIKTWPRDKQPFWYINWQAIQAHRGDVNNSAQPAQTQLNARSFFAG